MRLVFSSAVLCGNHDPKVKNSEDAIKIFIANANWRKCGKRWESDPSHSPLSPSSVLFSPPPDLRLKARTRPPLRVAVDFRRLIKSKQEVMATGAVLSVLMQILSFLAEILQSDTIKKY